MAEINNSTQASPPRRMRAASKVALMLLLVNICFALILWATPDHWLAFRAFSLLVVLGASMLISSKLRGQLDAERAAERAADFNLVDAGPAAQAPDK